MAGGNQNFTQMDDVTGGIQMKRYWLVMTALAMALLFSSYGSWALGQAREDQFQFWLSNLLLNVSAGILIIALVATLMGWFNVPERHESTLGYDLGIVNFYPEWINNPPPGDFFREIFSTSNEVEIMGVTLFNTIIQYEWFEEELQRRLTRNKKTRFLFLNPTGREINRREKEGSGRTLTDRAIKTRDKIQRGMDLARIHESKRIEIVRYFDFTPQINWLRFDSTAYVVLIMYAKGGVSPALKLDKKGILFQKYQNQFEDIWKDQLPNSVEKLAIDAI